MTIDLIIELIIGVFAGYCCAYFLSHKFMNMTPTELIIEFLEAVKDKLESEKIGGS